MPSRSSGLGHVLLLASRDWLLHSLRLLSIDQRRRRRSCSARIPLPLPTLPFPLPFISAPLGLAFPPAPLTPSAPKSRDHQCQARPPARPPPASAATAFWFFPHLLKSRDFASTPQSRVDIISNPACLQVSRSAPCVSAHAAPHVVGPRTATCPSPLPAAPGAPVGRRCLRAPPRPWRRRHAPCRRDARRAAE